MYLYALTPNEKKGKKNQRNDITSFIQMCRFILLDSGVSSSKCRHTSACDISRVKNDAKSCC